MDPAKITIRHAGKRYDVEVDVTSPGEMLKLQVYSLTGVEPERQKLLYKGKLIKDDTDLEAIGVQTGHSMMLMGTSASQGSVFARPKVLIKFVEDMTDAEAAQQNGAIPVGLRNSGNTCYLNATLQVLRAIPELHTALATYKGSMISAGETNLVGNLRDLFKAMSSTMAPFHPFAFLAALRIAFPQFAEKAREGMGYAQQDAEEAWTQIVNQLKYNLMIRSGDKAPIQSFTEKYMAGQFVSRLYVDDDEAKMAGEQTSDIRDEFLKINCHIGHSTNHLRDGILGGLTERIEKRSPVLGRDASYTKISQIARLPQYLTVHFVRFYWKRSIKKKAKIMRKVSFPHELDMVEFCTDDLKKALIPVRDKIREIHKDEEDLERARKRHHRNRANNNEDSGATASKSRQKAPAPASSLADGDVTMEDVGETYKTDAQVDAERETALRAAKKELEAMISASVTQDDSTNQSGLYELRGVVTHQGASADSGHYTAYVKRSRALPTGELSDASRMGRVKEEVWWWFNDDKVTEVTADKIDGLAGGGESHSALILLYRAVPLPLMTPKPPAKTECVE